MKKLFITLTTVFVLSIVSATAYAQECAPITGSQLRSMLVNMGFTVKDLNTTPGSEQIEIKNTTSGLDIYLLCEVSASKNFVWLTALLNSDSTSYQSRTNDLLKQNGIVQPAQFYITKTGSLKFGLAAENRGMNAAILRRHIDMVSSNIAKTRAFWEK
jgi:hypothetical protein